MYSSDGYVISTDIAAINMLPVQPSTRVLGIFFAYFFCLSHIKDNGGGLYPRIWEKYCHCSAEGTCWYVQIQTTNSVGIGAASPLHSRPHRVSPWKHEAIEQEVSPYNGGMAHFATPDPGCITPLFHSRTVPSSPRERTQRDIRILCVLPKAKEGDEKEHSFLKEPIICRLWTFRHAINKYLPKHITLNKQHLSLHRRYLCSG